LQDASGYGLGTTFPNVSDTSAPVIDFSADFHIFGAELNATHILYYVDGNLVFVIEPPVQSDPRHVWGKSPYTPFAAMYGIINYSVAPYGCAQPVPMDAWATPHQLFVDYLRVYELVDA